MPKGLLRDKAGNMVWLCRTVQEQGCHAVSRTQNLAWDWWRNEARQAAWARIHFFSVDQFTTTLLVTSNTSSICSSDPLTWDLPTETGLRLIRRKHFLSPHKELFWNLEMPVTATIPDRALKQALLHLTYESLHSASGEHQGHHREQKHGLPAPATPHECPWGQCRLLPRWHTATQSGWTSFRGYLCDALPLHWAGF